MKEVSEEKDIEEEGDGSDISGYHSDSESAVMTSGNSPFISKEARFSFLSRSGKTSNQSSPFKKGLQYERNRSVSTTFSLKYHKYRLGCREQGPQPCLLLHSFLEDSRLADLGTFKREQFNQTRHTFDGNFRCVGIFYSFPTDEILEQLPLAVPARKAINKCGIR